MRNFIESGIRRLKIHSVGEKPRSIKERNGIHCLTVTREEPVSQLTSSHVEAYKAALIRFNVTEPDIERHVRYLTDPIALAERDEELKTAKVEGIYEMPDVSAQEAAVSESTKLSRRGVVFEWAR